MTYTEAQNVWILRDAEEPAHNATFYRFGGDFSHDCRQAFPFDTRDGAEQFAARYQLRHGFALVAETLATAISRG